MRSVRFMAFLFLFTFFYGTSSWAALPEFTELAERSGPAVVNISTVKLVGGQGGPGQFFGPQDRRGTPWDDFFDQFERFFNGRQGKPRRQQSLGSGFIISKDGFIVTNNHVVENADEITINLQGGVHSYEATIVGRDPETDLALLKIEPDTELSVLRFGSSDKAKVGEWVVAIGNPFGLDNTVTAGVISAKERVINAGPYDNFIQTDASINPGNSGGPLLNLDGEVIGINTAIIATGQGIGFAVPSNMAKNVIDQLKANKRVVRGWLGVSIQNVDENTAKALGLDEPKGALVASVQSGEPADAAGIRVGDVIIAMENEPVDDAGDLTRKVGALPPGTKIKTTVWRDNRVKDITVTLGERNMSQVSEGRTNGSQEGMAIANLGLSLRPVTQAEAESLDLEAPRGLLVVQVEENSLAEEENIRPGDVIFEANGKKVDTLDQFRKILDGEGKKKGVLLLLLRRSGQNLFVTIPLKDNR